MIHIGFTGTRNGMTDAQRLAVRQLVAAGDRRGDIVAHHGDCLGADEDFHRLMRELDSLIVAHPGNVPSMRAFASADEIKQPAPFMIRNAAIVAASDVMVATPAEMTEQQRGGTWATIRMARRARKPLIVVFPNGTTEGSWSDPPPAELPVAGVRR